MPTLAATALAAALTIGLERDVGADTWVGVDGLGRALPTSAQVGPPRADRTVGIFYFLWLGQHSRGVHDLTTILADAQRTGVPPRYGPVGAFHHWGEPALGYYASDDRWMIRRHLTLLADAGVDVLFCDATNAFTYDGPARALFEVADELRASGHVVPRVAFICWSRSGETAQRLYDTWYGAGQHRASWFAWEGKPLLLANAAELSPVLRAFFTVRTSWFDARQPWRREASGPAWTWGDPFPQALCAGEMVSVSAATHPIAKVGRSHDGRRQPPPERSDPARGAYFEAQWRRARRLDPRLVFVTGWNEWVAQRFLWGEPARVGHVGYGTPGAGDSYFVDQYDAEFSRDLEPHNGALADHAYYALVANVRRYKGARAIAPIRSGRIEAARPFDGWASVAPEFRDHVGETRPRDAVGFDGSTRLVNSTGRNDLVAAKVSVDAAHVWFHVRARDALTPAGGADWMRLHLNVDGRRLRVNAAPAADGRTTSVEAWDAARHAWRDQRRGPDSDARLWVSGDQLVIALPRRHVGNAATFEFKWVDHCAAGELLDDWRALLANGDAAPPGRFWYRAVLGPLSVPPPAAQR